MGTEPDANTTCLVCKTLLSAVGGRDEHLVPRQQAAMPVDTRHPIGLEQRHDASGHRLHDRRPSLLHGREIELDAAELDAVNRELLLCAQYSSEDSSSALEGMQPAFRHVPPKA